MMTKSTQLTPHIDPTGIATPRPKVDRRLPPPELNARRTRKRNQAHHLPPRTPTPALFPETQATLTARPKRPGVQKSARVATKTPHIGS